MKRLVVLFAFVAIFLLSGCDYLTLSRETNYSLDNDNISFSLPKAWEESTNDIGDLTLVKSSAELNMIVYKKIEVDNISATKLLDNQIKEKMTDMTDYSLVKEYNTNKMKDRIIYSKLYTASRDGIERQYFFNVVEFLDSDTYVYAVYEAKEIYMNYNIGGIQRLLTRMKWSGEGTDIAMN